MSEPGQGLSDLKGSSVPESPHQEDVGAAQDEAGWVHAIEVADAQSVQNLL